MFMGLESGKEYYGKMYYFGSGAEYGSDHYTPYMEESYFGRYMPRDSYGFSKFIMSKICDTTNNIYDLRLFGVFGKYEEWKRRFISNAICNALINRHITIQKNVFFDYIWVNDLAEIMKWFIHNDPIYKHYNICRGEKIDLFSLAVLVREILNIDCEIEIKEKGFKTQYTGSNIRMKNEIKNITFTSFELAIKNLSDYYMKIIDTIAFNEMTESL